MRVLQEAHMFGLSTQLVAKVDLKRMEQLANGLFLALIQLIDFASVRFPRVFPHSQRAVLVQQIDHVALVAIVEL